MKIFISVDIEGVACISARSEIDMGQQSEFAPFGQQMTAEATAACAGAYSAGAEEVTVKDAHWTGRNMDPHAFSAPDGKSLRLIRGWSGHPFAMVQGIDETFDGAAFIGYHSAAGVGGNPLAHTISGGKFARVELNGDIASEFLIYAYAAASVGVPVVFLSGDRALCDEATRRIDGIVTVPVLEGSGASCISISPTEAVNRIQDGVENAVTARNAAPLELPPEFHVRIVFNEHPTAYAKSFYPGAALTRDTDVSFESSSYFEVLRFLWFMAQ